MTSVSSKDRLEAGAGVLRINRTGAIRSYDHLGNVFSWEPPCRVDFRRAALDVEAKDQPFISSMSARFRLPQATFLRRWTASEVSAKVLDMPILEFLKIHGLSPDPTQDWTDSNGVWVRALDQPTHWAAVALLI